MEEMKEITTNDIQKLLQKIKANGNWESYYLLTLPKIHQSGSAFDRDEDFFVLEGDADVVELSSTADQYGRCAEYLIIPKALGTIVKSWREYSDFNHTENVEQLWAFTEDGWKSITVRK